MTTGPGTGRVSTSEVVRSLLNRTPSVPESSVTIGVTAKRLHTWEIVVRGEDVDECARVAQRLDDGLAAKYAHEMEDDSLASQLAASVVKGGKP